MTDYKRQITIQSDLEFKKITDDIIKVGNRLYSRGLLSATSWNISSVIKCDPLELAISATGVDKGNMDAKNVLIVDSNGEVIDGNGKPSAETLLHLAVIRNMKAKSIIHTHSIWSTILSRRYLSEGFVELNGYEMLKALEGNTTHNENEILPVFENSQDMVELSKKVSKYLIGHPKSHGFLLSGHGLYTWGKNLSEAMRSIEAIEFLLEIRGREISLER